MSNSRKLALAAILGSSIAFGHYGWERFRAATIIVPVTGRVTLDGQPLANAFVKFSPTPRSGQLALNGNPGSYGYTDDDGNFSLFQIENDLPGAMIGEHKIILRTGKPGPGPDGFVDERVPFTWRKGVRSHHVSWTGAGQAVFRIETIDHFSPGISSLAQTQGDQGATPGKTSASTEAGR